MRVTNPNTDREIIATVAVVQDDLDTLETFVIPADEGIDVDDYAVASTLVEYGATADPADLAAARALWAERNRSVNSRTASASASEGEILGRQQVTTDVATGSTTATGGTVLRGAELDAAVRQANESGASISTSGSADERRAALSEWQALQGSSTPPEGSGQYVLTATGELYLDAEGAPVDLATVEVDADGNAVLDDDGNPIPVEASNP